MADEQLNVAPLYKHLETRGKIWFFSTETIVVSGGIVFVGVYIAPTLLVYWLLLAVLVAGALTYLEHKFGQTGILKRYIRFWLRPDAHHGGPALPKDRYQPRVYAPWRYLDDE